MSCIVSIRVSDYTRHSTVIMNQGFSSWYNQIHTDCLCPGIFCENNRFYFIFYKTCYQI